MNAPVSDPNARQVGGDHYKAEFQHWDLVPRLGLVWQEACALKYAIRCFKKGKTVEDLEKASHYTEKLIQLLQHGVVTPYPLFQEYVSFHVGLYIKFVDAQALEAPTPEMEERLRHILLQMATWSFGGVRSSQNPNGTPPVQVLAELRESIAALIQVYEAHTNGARNAANPETNVVSQSASAEDMMAYVAQAADVAPAAPSTADVSIQPVDGVPPTAPDAGPPIVVSPQVPPPADNEEEALFQALSNENQRAFSMFLSNRGAPTPIQVWLPLLESLRRHTDRVKLSLEPRLSGQEGHVYTSFRDYAEPMGKIALGLQALEESIPNKQLSRTLAGFGAIIDGVNCMTDWLLRMIEGSNPVVKDPAERREILTTGYSLRKLVIQNSLHELNKQGMDSSLYTFGVRGSNPVPPQQ